MEFESPWERPGKSDIVVSFQLKLQKQVLQHFIIYKQSLCKCIHKAFPIFSSWLKMIKFNVALSLLIEKLFLQLQGFNGRNKRGSSDELLL